MSHAGDTVSFICGFLFIFVTVVNGNVWHEQASRSRPAQATKPMWLFYLLYRPCWDETSPFATKNIYKQVNRWNKQSKRWIKLCRIIHVMVAWLGKYFLFTMYEDA